MRVALLSRAVFPLHGVGGLERHVAALEKYLRRAGCEVTLYTTPPESAPPDEAGSRSYVSYRLVPWPRRKGFVVLDRDTNYLAWSVRAAKRLLSGARPDVVQADGGAGFGYAVLAGAGAPPLVLHPHGMEEFKARAAKRALYLPLRSATRFAARQAARVVAPDRSMREEVRRYLGVEEERIVLLPNAIDLEEIDRPAAPADLGRFGIPEDVPLLLSVGRLEANKGFRHLVRALARTRSRFFWLLAGEGPDRARLASEIEREGIGDRARLVGRVPENDLHALYRRSDLFVHPTLYEGSSLVTLEAMAHRKPVVATRVGGIPDKVVPEESGLLVPPADVEALARGIDEALRSRDRLAAWGRRGRQIVEDGFSWRTRVENVIELYRSLAGSRSRGIAE